jgi:hypothetical protein
MISWIARYFNKGEASLKRFLICLNLLTFISFLGCGGMLRCPEPLKFYKPLQNPLDHSLAIGKFENKSYARYPLFISGRELQELFQDELQKNRVFKDVFTVRIKKRDDEKAIEQKAIESDADLLMEGEISESECHFVGSNQLAVPMYLLIIAFPLSFNIKAQTWEGKSEVIYRIREIETGKVVFSRRIEAKAYKNFSIWDERTERHLNKNYVRRMLTPLVLQNLKTAVAKDLVLNFKE